MRKFLIAATALMGMHSAFAADVMHVGAVEGTCRSMTVGTDSGPAPRCSNKLINMDFPNGRNGFAFIGTTSRNQTIMVGFFGDGHKQLHPDADTAIQPVDRIDFTFQDKLDPIPAVGSCRFANPFKGRPAIISCTAQTKFGTFAGEFTSNGQPPKLTEIPVK